MGRAYLHNQRKSFNPINGVKYEPVRSFREIKVDYSSDKDKFCWVPSLVWESAVPPEICKLIIKHAEENCELTRDEIFDVDNPKNKNIRNSYSYCSHDLWINLFAMGWILEANRQMYNYDLSKYDIENSCQISKYTSNINSFFAPHSDFSGEIRKNNPIHTRKLSLSIQLSSEDDYEGGDLLLYYHQQSTKLDGKPVLNEFLVPKALGTVVVFDSRIVHEVTPIISGTRHALVKWYHGDTPLR